MFNIFKKKEPFKVIDKILIEEDTKWKVLLNYYLANPDTIFIAWFNDTHSKASSWFSANTHERINLVMAREAGSIHATGKNIIFIEHYPLQEKEKELYERLHLQTVTVYSSLREPLFQQFGSDRIINMMKTLGMKEDEVVEHAMITNSIKNAQEKISKKIQVDFNAESQEQWLKSFQR